MISELITFRITKAKAKVKFGVKYLCGHECEISSVQLISIRKRKRKNIVKARFLQCGFGREAPKFRFEF